MKVRDPTLKELVYFRKEGILGKSQYVLNTGLTDPTGFEYTTRLMDIVDSDNYGISIVEVSADSYDCDDTDIVYVRYIRFDDPDIEVIQLSKDNKPMLKFSKAYAVCCGGPTPSLVLRQVSETYNANVVVI